jgi:SpoVK/Ycf46/Vps4 family AAA+-type ATPase
LAERQKWDLISLSPSDFVSDSLDRIEFRSRKIFSDLMRVDKCVILMDEMDSLFRDRKIFADKPGTIIEYVIPALLPKLQDLREYASNRDVAVFYITNYLENIDAAISRGGRMDSRLIVLPYTAQARLKLAERFVVALKAPASAFAALKEAFSDMPCNHVYRDVEALAKLAASGDPKEDRRGRGKEWHRPGGI